MTHDPQPLPHWRDKLDTIGYMDIIGRTLQLALSMAAIFGLLCLTRFVRHGYEPLYCLIAGPAAFGLMLVAGYASLMVLALLWRALCRSIVRTAGMRPS